MSDTNLSRLPPLEAHLGFWLRRVSNPVSAAFARGLAERQTTVAEWVALRLLAAHPDLTPGALADAMGMTRGAVSKVLDRLDRKGWATRRPHRADGRVQLISMTPEGARVLPELAQIADRNDRRFFGRLTADEQATLRRLLEKLARDHAWTEVPVDCTTSGTDSQTSRSKQMSDAIATLQAAQQRAMAIRPEVNGFPYLAEVLRRAGVRRNVWFLPSCQSLYLMEAGAVVDQGIPLVSGAADVPDFDREALIAALRADQAGQSTFREFLAASWNAGVVRYEVDFAARRVIYFGADGDAYMEEYPAVDVTREE